MNKKRPTKTSNRRRKKGLFSKPWFVAFLCAMVVIVILSVALFRLSCQKPGEKFMETMERFFLFEPWFFGIVVGVILLTLIIFNIFRILRGAGENYSVNGTEPLNDPEVIVESQGFEEYPSKVSVPQITPPIIIEPTTQLADKHQTTVTNTQEPPFQSYKPASVPSAQNIMPQALSLQLNEGAFYDEKQFHDEDDSMAEYGLGENDQFNDEGSFIGLYNRDRIQNYMAQFNKNNLNN